MILRLAFVFCLGSLAVRAEGPPVGIATFNLAWAGTVDDFRQHLAVCNAPAVNWCDTRARAPRGASSPTPEEQMRAKACQEATIAAAGGRAASMRVAPCNAYRSAASAKPGQPPDPTATRHQRAYQVKLDQLRRTIDDLVGVHGIRILALQEVSSVAVVREILGQHSPRFEVCLANHDAFQSLAFAWDKRVTSLPGQCETYAPLAILDPPLDPDAFRRVRPGLSLRLTLNGAPVTFLNVHLKAGCASVRDSERYPGRLLTDAHEACSVLNRQVPALETWIETLARTTPRLVLMGDFNRRIDDEEAMAIAPGDVRSDGSDPTASHRALPDGRVSTRYLWPEIADGAPALHRVPLAPEADGCKGFQGLDHVVISAALRRQNPAAIEARKMRPASLPGQALQTSDHCPQMAWLRF
jgi:endonuclease/exonuclease/phosphatase family metal-dependent hydrolase